MPVSLDEVPESASAPSLRLRDELVAILGDDLVASWIHGGMTFPDRSKSGGDLDICAVVSGLAPNERDARGWPRDPTSRPSRIQAAEQAVAADFGVDLDTTYVLEEEARRGSLPSMAFRRSRRENGWAVYRAHWLAGQYVHLHGPRPEEIVIPPTAAELRYALDREVEHLERHVYEGDADDPYEVAYAVLNGCRILYTIDTGSPVISKRSAAKWGIEHLPSRWHDPIGAAERSYQGSARVGDHELLRPSMAPFVSMVRRRLPPRRHASKRQPRWS